MALLFEAVVDRLEASTGVGAKAGNRIYPITLPQNPTYPAITYHQVSGNHLQNHNGRMGLQETRMQVDVWARTYNDARDTAEQVRLAMMNYSGSTGGVRVQATIPDGDRDLFEGTGTDDRIFRVSQDYMMWAREST